MKSKTPKETIKKALDLYQTGMKVREIESQLRLSAGMVSRFARSAGIGRNKPYRKRAAVKRSALGAKKAAVKRSALDGSLRIVADLVTTPGLNNNQRIKMIAAYLNER